MGRVTIAAVVVGAEKNVFVDQTGDNAGGVTVEHNVTLSMTGPDETTTLTMFLVPDAEPFYGLMGKTVSVSIDYDD